jgi:hypothetical protein
VIFPSTVIMRFEVAAFERHFASNSFASDDALRVGKSERNGKHSKMPPLRCSLMHYLCCVKRAVVKAHLSLAKGEHPRES